MKSRSIRYYFFTSIATVLITSVLVMGLLQTFLSMSYFRRDKEQMLGKVVYSIEQGARTGQLDEAGDAMQTVPHIAQATGVSVFITNTDGRVDFSTGQRAPEIGTQVAPAIMEVLATTGSYEELGRLSELYTVNHYTYAAPLIDSNNQTIGYVFAMAEATGMMAYMLDTMSTYLFSSMLVLLVSGVLALVLTNRMVIPVRRISVAAQRFAQGDYSARVPVEGDDELAQLAITFNEMAQSFEATDTSRRSFMGNIAHELRTPMTTIKGFIDGMLDGTIPPEERDKYLTVVSDEVGRLARLTKNMLDISRLEAGEYTPNIVRFDVWHTMASVFLGAEKRLEEKNLTVKGLEAEEPAEVLADEDFTHQILFNLLDNAIKFTGEGGEISAHVEYNKSKNTVTVGIRNTGQGIPANVLPYVFDRFYKADKSRGMNTRGAGLGLHISKVLLGLMGGRIWAESDGESYSDFIFTLPAAPPQKRSRGRHQQEKKPEELR